MRNALILERVLNTPLMAEPGKAETVAAVVLRHAGLDVTINAPGASMGPMQEQRMRRRMDDCGTKPFLFDPALGVAVIEITGSLAHRQWHLGESSGVMGYDGIGAAFQSALDDREVRAVLLDIHSPGGEVSGAFQLADRIFAARETKPIVAVADEMAFSAAYLLAAAAEELWLASDTAQAGSVGVVLVHMSFEEFLAKEGVVPTIIKAGARKADGNPYQDLAPDVVDVLQLQVDAVHDLFVGRVARFRNMAPAEVRATEAGLFMGEAAVTVGFADGIAPPARILDTLAGLPAFVPA